MKKGLSKITKFVVTGVVFYSICFIFNNRSDFLSIGITPIVSFGLGGIAMWFSLKKEIYSLRKDNAFLKRKLAKNEKKIELIDSERNRAFHELRKKSSN